MTRPLEHTQHYTVEEYFRIDSNSEVRHEYVDGRIIDMAGGTGRHSRIIANVIGSTWSQLRGKTCQMMESNIRVQYGRRIQYGYADALIVCGQPQYDSKAPTETTLLNPRVLIEVLSDSTEAYDRGRKFARYREIESFVEYVLIDSNQALTDVYRRQPSGLWILQSYGGLEATAAIESVGIELPLSEIYAGVEFPPDIDEEPKNPSSVEKP